MFNLFKKADKGSTCCNVKIEEVKEEKAECCEESEQQECCSSEKKDT